MTNGLILCHLKTVSHDKFFVNEIFFFIMTNGLILYHLKTVSHDKFFVNEIFFL